MSRSVIVLLPAAVLLLGACAQPPGGVGNERAAAGAPAAADAAPTTVPAATDMPGARVDPGKPPRWRPAEELVSGLPSAGGDNAFGDGAAELPAGDPALRQAVAGRCGSRPASVTESSLLRSLVAELQTGGVAPALAADALIIGRCGDLADIVSEVVARYGAEAAVPVIERAVALSGEATALVIERAAAEGLLRAGSGRASAGGAPPPLAGAGDDSAMLYFPLGARTRTPAERDANNLGQLLGGADPDYGIYTYILAGEADAGSTDEHLATYRELLRVIETYVLAAGPDGARPDPAAHTFLVPVHARRSTSPLAERSSPVLSAAIRRTLADYLRRAGESALAARLATAPGPFLVSSLEPRLVPGKAPGQTQGPRLLVDLSRVGPEYMYSVVDAYDREIAPAAAGRVESLLAVRGRLVDMFPDPSIDAAAAGPAGEWLFVLGEPDAGQAAVWSAPLWVSAVQQGR
ncbi:MAG: hypothetical protein GVY09_08740 [Gammaproteobacteria bacterium]|jgi:hypothetical protein|nr:hypothetical protein [Gammaproteobacteria bacterium]